MLPADVMETDEIDAPQPSGGSSRLVMWLVLGSFLVLFAALFLASTAVKEANVTLAAQVEALQATLAVTPPADPTLEALNSQYMRSQGEKNALESIQATLIALHVNWPVIMAALLAYDPSEMAVSAVTQTAEQITISGVSSDETVVMAYADTLRAAGPFEQVTVEQINLKTLPTPTPALTPQAETQPEAAAPAKVAQFSIALKIKKADTPS